MICDLRFAICSSRGNEALTENREWVRDSLRRLLLVVCVVIAPSAFGFEGRINAVMIRGNQTDALLYTVDTNFLRVEMTATNRPNPVDILDRNTGELTLLFPNNRSFVRLKPDGGKFIRHPARFSANACPDFRPALARSRHRPVCPRCRTRPRLKASARQIFRECLQCPLCHNCRPCRICRRELALDPRPAVLQCPPCRERQAVCPRCR